MSVNILKYCYNNLIKLPTLRSDTKIIGEAEFH